MSVVKFVSYTGRYPSLCLGILTLEIDGEKYIFGHKSVFEKKTVKEDESTLLKCFWNSGGQCGYDEKKGVEYLKKGAWRVEVNNLPKNLRPYASQIEKTLNDNIPQGCCGGCW